MSRSPPKSPPQGNCLPVTSHFCNQPLLSTVAGEATELGVAASLAVIQASFGRCICLSLRGGGVGEHQHHLLPPARWASGPRRAERLPGPKVPGPGFLSADCPQCLSDRWLMEGMPNCCVTSSPLGLSGSLGQNLG